jgi:arsenate reductase
MDTIDRMSPDAAHVLFVCVHNAGRSQMAQAFAERHGSPAIVAESAGSDPAAAIWPTVVEAMAEVGLDLAGRRPARLDADTQRRADLAVTMGCGDACPYVPGPVEDWDVADPAGRSLAEVRAIRDDVEARVLELLRRRFGRSGADRRAAERA